MNKRRELEHEIKPRLVSVEKGCAYCGLGRTSGTRFLKEIGAEIKFGKRCLYDLKVIDKALDMLAGEKEC